MDDLARERRALALFDAAMDVPEHERDDWIARAADDDLDVLARVRSLLAAERGEALATGGALAAAADERPPPERIGAYRLTALIGRGGMGAVYRGERDRGDFAHVVAIKLIRPGLLGDALRDRFARERQTLAQLSHPNIAQLYDGGEVDGVPYIVMELVEGMPLAAWVADAAPDRDARLRLFDTVCRAVGFAHRSLIVHRDLTPANVLVARDGTVKLIDFGIARAPDREAEAERGSPSLAGLSLTPGYAAPERMTSARVSTAADIYSLGRLLAWLVPERDREGDAIVACATATDPEARYPTAEALADDVAAWTSGRPVAAVSGGRRYRAAKALRRHAAAIGAGALAVLLLIGATAYSIAAERRAETARAEAERRFDDVRVLAQAMLFDLNDRFARVPGNTAARAALADRAQHYLNALAAAPDAAPALRRETARGLIRLAEIQGVPGAPNLGERARASESLARAGALLATLPKEDAHAAALRGLAGAHRAMIAAHGEGDGAGARRLLMEARGTLDAVPAAARGAAWIGARRALHLAALEEADLAGERARFVPLLAAARTERAGWPATWRESHAARGEAAVLDYFAALPLSDVDPSRGLDAHLALDRRFAALLAERPDEPRLLYRAAWNLADGFGAGSRAGREAEADRLIRRGVAVIDRLAAIDGQDDSVRALQANIHESFAQNLRDHDRFDDALAAQAQVLAIRRGQLGAVPDGRKLGNLGFSQMIHGIIARDGGRRALACASWRDAEATLRRAAATGKITGFHARFVPGIAAHVAACRNGGSISGPMV